MGEPGTRRVTEWVIGGCFALLCVGGVFLVFGDDLAQLFGNTPAAVLAQSPALQGTGTQTQQP
jgi:hypothetical protein